MSRVGAITDANVVTAKYELCNPTGWLYQHLKKKKDKIITLQTIALVGVWVIFVLNISFF